MRFAPIRLAEFNGGVGGTEFERITRTLRRLKLQVDSNYSSDPLRYYTHRHADWRDADTSGPMFIALCKMNEFFAAKDVEVIRVETILEGEGTIYEGSGEVGLGAGGIRVYYRELGTGPQRTKTQRARRKRPKS